ncbi:MAG TPA: class I SAM-dependent methyltransferase [Gammaproteobacteria bacterium]|nr:class I SAM-dependent methyltransferase [Gammaproteobacteria bacterium]
MNPASIKSAYKRYAPVYDALFGAIFHPARETIVQALDPRPGQRILEVGVGTGLSLSLYPEHARVTGIDLCKEMLDKARTRVREQNLDQVEALLEMDAEDMQFPDSSFDKVVAMYVVSVAANPLKLVDEMRRVCKPGGDIFIVNHFRSNSPVMGTLEGILSPMSKLAGFRTNMELEAFLEATGLEVVEVSKTNVFGYWKMLRCRNAG